MYLLIILALSLFTIAVQAQVPPGSQCVSTAVAGGTGDAITIANLPCTPTTTLLILAVKFANTTSTPTLGIQGGVTLPIVRFDGTAIQPGDLIANSYQQLTSNGIKWFLMTLQPPTSIGFSGTSALLGDIATFAATNGARIQDSGVNINSAGDFNINTTGMTLQVIPLGNAILSNTAFNLQSQTPPGTPVRNYQMNVGMVVTNGVNGGNAGNGDEVNLYMGIEAKTNNGNVWNFNPLMQIDAGSSNIGHHQVEELDIANNNVNVPADRGPNGVNFPAPANTPGSPLLYIYGSIAECSGTHDCTAAYLTAGANFFHRGFVCWNNISEACFEDFTNSPTVGAFWGTHNIGFDFVTAPNTGMPIRWVDVATTPVSNDISWLSNAGDNEFGSQGDTNLVLKSSGTSTPSWSLQVITDSSPTGRFRIADNVSNQEMMSIQQTNGRATFFGPITALGMPTTCTGQPTGTLRNNAGVVNVCP